MARQTNSHADLKLWTAQQAAQQVSAGAQATSSDPADDAHMTVEQATRGMDDNQKFLWLQEQLEKTIKDMEAKGITVDRQKIMYVDFYGGPDNNQDTRIIRAGNLPPGATIQDLKTTLVHEVDHSQHPVSAKPSFKERQQAEHHADHAMAVVYGAQATVDLMNKYANAEPGSLKRHDRKDPHGNWMSRMERIKHDFPEENVQLPKKAPHAQKNNKAMAASGMAV